MVIFLGVAVTFGILYFREKSKSCPKPPNCPNPPKPPVTPVACAPLFTPSGQCAPGSPYAIRVRVEGQPDSFLAYVGRGAFELHLQEPKTPTWSSWFKTVPKGTKYIIQYQPDNIFGKAPNLFLAGLFTSGWFEIIGSPPGGSPGALTFDSPDVFPLGKPAAANLTVGSDPTVTGTLDLMSNPAQTGTYLLVLVASDGVHQAGQPVKPKANVNLLGASFSVHPLACPDATRNEQIVNPCDADSFVG
jgi:hypothetical protein